MAISEISDSVRMSDFNLADQRDNNFDGLKIFLFYLKM